MANRIVGNTIIVDSAMGNAVLLTSAGMAIQASNLWINAIGFYSIDTTGVIILSETDTTDIVFRTAWITQAAGASFQPSMQFCAFGNPHRVTNLKVPTLTAGTGFIYLA